MTLSPKLGAVEISTLWHFRLPLPIQMFIKVASSPRLSGIGIPSPILWSHPLKMQRIVLLSSLLWWQLGTNYLIIGPGEWLSFRRFTSKLSWSCIGKGVLTRRVSEAFFIADMEERSERNKGPVIIYAQGGGLEEIKGGLWFFSGLTRGWLREKTFCLRGGGLWKLGYIKNVASF